MTLSSTETRTDRQVDVRTPAGETSGSVTLPGELFDANANVSLMHQVVIAQLAAARQGTHSTKTRGQVSGGGAKPYRQKGTGRARQGSTRAPQFAGGGVVHGPHAARLHAEDPEEDEGRRPARCPLRPGPRGPGARGLRVRRRRRPEDQDRPGHADLGHAGQARPGRARPRRRPQLGEPAQRAAGAPDRGRPAQHLRRAGRPTRSSSPRPRSPSTSPGRPRARAPSSRTSPPA